MFIKLQQLIKYWHNRMLKIASTLLPINQCMQLRCMLHKNITLTFLSHIDMALSLAMALHCVNSTTVLLATPGDLDLS